MYTVIEFDRKECTVVPLLWLVEDQKFCLWPCVNKEDVFEEYVISKKVPASSGWKKYKIKKIHRICVTYEEASGVLSKLIEDSCSSSAGDGDQIEPLIRKELAEENFDECEKQFKRKHTVDDAEPGVSKKPKTATSEAEWSGNEFSSEDERDETLKNCNSQLKEIPDEPQNQANLESFDTTVTYSTSTSSAPISSNLCSPRTSTPNSFAKHSLETNLGELLLRRIEKVIALQDQHSLILDNIQRNQQMKNNDLIERPRDFPKLPILNKAEYLAVEEFLTDPVKFAYMKTRLSTIGGSSGRNTTMNMMKFVLSNKVGMKFNWAGKDKRPFKKTKMCAVIFEAVKLAYSHATNEVNDKIIKETIQDWLKLSKARFNYSHKKEIVNSYIG